jgi:hypothetical protein
MTTIARPEAPPVAPLRRFVSLFLLAFGATAACFLVGAERMPLAFLVVVLFTTMNVALASSRLAAARTAFWTMIVGIVVELVLCMAHVTYFRVASAKYPLMPPLWLIGVWGLLGSTLPTGFAFLRGRAKAAAAAGLVLAPCAYAAAIQLKALGFGFSASGGELHPVRSLIVIAIVWSGVLPFLVLLSRKSETVADWIDSAS